jgi:O-antigen ligase
MDQAGLTMRSNNRITLRGSILAGGLELAIPLGLALFVGVLIVRSATAAIAFAAAVALLLSFARSPLNSLALVIFLIPFSQTTLLSEPVAEFPGSRPFLLLGAFVTLISFLNWRMAEKLPRSALLYFLFFEGLLVFAVLRSLPNIGLIGDALDQEYSTVGFILSYVVKPSVYLIPMVIIAKFARDHKTVNRLVDTLVLSLIVLSAYFLYDYFFLVKGQGDIETAWEVVSVELGLWKGQAGFLYVIGFPMVIARYFAKKDVISIAGIILCLVAVGFLYSRTAYVTVVLAFFLFMFFSKRSKFLPVLLLLGVAVSFFVSETMVERASKGIEEGDLNQFTSGRIEHQWLPLLEEYSEHPIDLAIGRGRYSVLTTRVWQSGILPGAMHPHNMFLEMILDAGVFSLMVVLVFVVVLMKKVYASLPNVTDRVSKEYLYGALVSMLCYLMGGMTTGSLFPTLENSYFWIICGLSLAIIGLVQQPPEDETEESA